MKTKHLQSFSKYNWGATFLFLLFTCLQISTFAQANSNHPPGPGDCYEHWKFKLYEDSYYQGDFLCFRKGEYHVDQDCNDYPYRRFSFKLRQGYIVCFYDVRGRLIRRINASQRNANFSFHRFVVKRAGQPENPHAPGYVDCYPDWKFKLFERTNHRGDFDCFRKGEYYAGNDCDDYRGRNVSFKLRSGYIVCFYDSHDRLLKKFTSSSNYYRGGFYKFIVKKAGHHNDHDDDIACYDDWRVKIFPRPQYRGEYRCFRKGEYNNGEDCDDYQGRSISFKIRNGWQLWVYNHRGQCVRKFRDNVPHYRGDFHHFVVKRIGNNPGYGH